MKQAGSTRLCVLVFKMILVLKELCTFHIGVKDMKIFCCTVIFPLIPQHYNLTLFISS